MRNLISAELLKLRTTRAFWAYVVSIVADIIREAGTTWQEYLDGSPG